MNTARVLARTISTTVSRTTKDEVPQGYTQIKDKYRHFQLNDGVPIHLKAGITDKFLYYSTLGLTAIGVVMMGDMLYGMSFPKRNN